ncbi:MAG TPA: hypothetical protein VN745_02625 [Verrucomicrobiae bacterium]|nr:hypothetical protein [Verrucomicrobiae bacterium]
MRRIHSAALVLALFAVPLALVARAFAAGPQECTMSCCRGERATAMRCVHGAGATPFAMCGRAAQMPDYGLAAPLAPTKLGASVTLDKPQALRASFAFAVLNFTNGYSFPPFEPPRA